MIGREFKKLIQRLNSMTRVSFDAKAKDKVTELLYEIIWSARSGEENHELTLEDEIGQIPNDFVFSEDMVDKIGLVEHIWMQQSPFVSA